MPKYKCTKKCFAGRLYEQGEIIIADKAPGEFFAEIASGSPATDKGEDK